MKKMGVLLILLILLSCGKSNEKRYLYFKQESTSKNFYLEGAKRKTLFNKRKPDIILKIENYSDLKKDYLEAFYRMETYSGILFEAKKNGEIIFGGKVEFTDQEEYIIDINEGGVMPSLALPYYYREEHEYTDSLHTIPLSTLCWLELADGKGIVKIVWLGKSYVL
ncbi:MAG: hypothetical protein OQK82_08910 [Candidatus Pacearchaeota archaeon]|nr:hypothetical protein [Candidatus Pacearchaeota archaeon]